MCLAIPGQIVEIVDDERDIAKVEFSGVRRNVNITLVRPDGADLGKWVLVHVGFALRVLDEEEAAGCRNPFGRLQAADHHEALVVLGDVEGSP